MPPSLYINVEGVKLSRHGSVSILHMYVVPAQYTYLTDVHTLGNEAFAAPGSKGGSLKRILESATILMC